MSEEEKIRRAEQISERRSNRIPVSSINNGEKNKITKLTKISIQILMSICIFGLCYFLHQNNSYALEVIKPILSNDTDFQKLYSEINEVAKVIMQEKNSEENKSQEENITTEETNSKNTTDDDQQDSEKENDITYIKGKTNYIKPLEGVITSRFGERESTDIVSPNHEGIDIGADEGTEIKASMAGVAMTVGENESYGKYIIIANEDISTLYGHCSELLIKEGDQIEQGKVIAKVGNTGKSTGPHLHFEIRRNEIKVNPEEIICFE